MSGSEPSGEIVAVGLDLGSSYFKGGLLDGRGRLGPVTAVPAPPLAGDEGRREGDARAYARAAAALLERVAGGLPQETPLGIASQRSTFVIWERETGRPIMPLVSWQDRRAADWCARHGESAAEVFAQTGLVLSAHYAGPKLAAMQEADPALNGALRSGRVLFGNLETYLVWLWSGHRVHETDLTMAARTSMLDLRTADWSPELLERFRVPRSILPRVRPSRGFRHRLERGSTLTASVADQASSALALFPAGTDSTLVNLGTGGFALRPAPRDERRPGYLIGPFDGDASNPRYALEGTINGAGVAVDRFGRGPTDLPVADPSPDAFCLPDVAGVGSPYWRPDVGLTLSAAAELLPPGDRRRVVLEGLLFRIRCSRAASCASPSSLPAWLPCSTGRSRYWSYLKRG
jgi:glycerol kinase